MKSFFDRVSSTRSDGEILARARLLSSFLLIYLLCMGFMALGDRIYAGSPYLAYSRLATIPFFLLILRRWLKVIRVRPPELLQQARQLAAGGRMQAARDKYLEAQQISEATWAQLDRARRILQDGLAVTIAQEIRLELARCSALLGEPARATQELEACWHELPHRGEVALELAELLIRQGEQEKAAQAIKQRVDVLDGVDKASLREQPGLLHLLGDTPLPAHSRFFGKILVARLTLAVLIATAIIHALHFYLGVI